MIVVIDDSSFEKGRKLEMLAIALDQAGLPPIDTGFHFTSWTDLINTPEWKNILEDAELILLDHHLNDNNIDGDKVYELISEIDSILSKKVYGISANNEQAYLKGKHIGINPDKLTQFFKKFKARNI